MRSIFANGIKEVWIRCRSCSSTRTPFLAAVYEAGVKFPGIGNDRMVAAGVTPRVYSQAKKYVHSGPVTIPNPDLGAHRSHVASILSRIDFCWPGRSAVEWSFSENRGFLLTVTQSKIAIWGMVGSHLQ